MNDTTGVSTHPHVSDAKISSPQEAAAHLTQMGGVGASDQQRVEGLSKEEPKAWVQLVGRPQDGWSRYWSNWSGTPYSKWDWVGMFMNVHNTSDYFFKDHPPVMTLPNGTKYISMEQQVAWQWAVNGNTYDTEATVDWLEEKRGSLFPWRPGEKEPYARYFWWDYQGKTWVTQGSA